MATLTKSHWQEVIQVRAEELTGLQGPRAMLEAVSKRDPILAELWERLRHAPPDPEPEAPVTKAQPGDSAWQEIEKRARAIMAEAENAVTMAEARTMVIERDPELYAAYREATME